MADRWTIAPETPSGRNFLSDETPVVVARDVEAKGTRRRSDPADGLVGRGEIGGDHSGAALRQRYRLTESLGGSGHQGHSSFVRSS
jgi:hypothetical protein